MFKFLSVAIASFTLALAPLSALGESVLIVEMADRAEANEPGTLNYMWTDSEDGSTGHVYERSADSDAALARLASFNQHSAESFLTMADPVRHTVYMNPSSALRQELAGTNPTYLPQIGGFAR